MNPVWESGAHSAAQGIDPALAFLMGGVLVIIALLLYDYFTKGKK
jgi:hypothetical protein